MLENYDMRFLGVPYRILKLLKLPYMHHGYMVALLLSSPIYTKSYRTCSKIQGTRVFVTSKCAVFKDFTIASMVFSGTVCVWVN